MKSFESHRQLVILFWGPICIKNTFYIIACSIPFVLLLFWSVLFEKLDCKHLRGSHFVNFPLNFRGRFICDVTMARHLGFSFANTGACAQVQVHHSLLVSQSPWHFDPADRKCARALGTRLDVAVNCVRSKNAQKQLARTSLKEKVTPETVYFLYSPVKSHTELSYWQLFELP